MKIAVLTENTANREGFRAEHGLSLYIETKKHKILFDTGQSDIFIYNAKKLGIDLADVDMVVLSHGHYDHGGGLGEFLKINGRASVYANKAVFGHYYAEDGRYLGIDGGLKESGRFIFTDNALKIDKELYLFTGNEYKRNYFMDNFGLFVNKNGRLTADDFLHEQYLIINSEKEKALISGCSHKGILNIMKWVEDKGIKAVFGGFHYKKLNVETDREYLRQAALELLKFGCDYYTCHCTGTEQYNYMKKYMKERLNYISAGDVISIF